jgi:hypothetical protein
MAPAPTAAIISIESFLKERPLRLATFGAGLSVIANQVDKT